VVLDSPSLEDEKVADLAVIDHGTARQGIHKTAAGSSKKYPDPGKSTDSVELSETTVLPVTKHSIISTGFQPFNQKSVSDGVFCI
jgi:hypothetical protein